ncbi:hypothetical protein N657DRAFT_675855 [Parathielavia appendiculata]|uniref:Uncharacterized protein n=1 Tax=Parathielavia appendiculata TaxID=2587402 RepID=A0AAN6TNZ7_9PEZI|nr:hypothetical protein N657DRAFT_675855 [Parathielavia appendiculata]
MLIWEQRPDLRACSTYLFRAQVSIVIKRFTARAWEKGITLQILRQLSVGISEKHVREVFKPFNRFDDRTDAADRDVAFAWQTGHRLLQIPTAIRDPLGLRKAPPRSMSSHRNEPVFGRLNVVAMVGEADERRRIASYLAEKLPVIRPLNPEDGKLAIARKQPVGSASSMIALRNGVAGQRLDIPRYYGQRGDCATCGYGWVVCGQMRIGLHLEEAASRRPKAHARLLAKYDSAKARDGFCENRSVVRRMIAALVTYDGQILGKVLTRLVLDQYGIDLGNEKEAKR